MACVDRNQAEVSRRVQFGDADDAHLPTCVAASCFKVAAADVCQHHNARQLTY